MSVVNIQVQYNPLPTLNQFHNSKEFSRLIVGPFGSGKSVAAVIELWKNSMLSKNTRYVIVRKTYRMLKDSVIKTFFRSSDDKPGIPKEAGVYQEADLVFKIQSPLGGTAEFLFRSAETNEDIDKFRGVEISGYWIDEAQEVAQDVKLILDGRLRFPSDHSRFISVLTTNPCDTAHWIYRDYVQSPLPNHVCFKQPWDENKANLPGNYYETMAAAFRDRPEMLKRYVYGEWGAIFSGKPVYGESFNFDFHVAKSHLNAIGGVVIDRGWDFGLSPACVITQVNPNGQWMVLRELCGQDISVDEFSDAVIEYCNREFPNATFEDVGDPAGRSRAQTDERTCMEILSSKGVFCREATTNALLPRLEAVKRKLTRTSKGRPQLVIDPRCKTLIDGFSGGYRFAQRRLLGPDGTTYSDVPEKNRYSHPHDALQYVALKLFGYQEFDNRLYDTPTIAPNVGIV